MMDPHHKIWNAQQQELLRALENPRDHDRAIELFMIHHGMVHSSLVTGPSTIWSYEDEVLQNLGEVDLRCIPAGEPHSIAWILWHLARCEDVTMNILIANDTQVLMKDDWQTRIGFDSRETGNAIDAAAIALLSQTVNLDALKAYRVAVGRRTREVVGNAQPAELKQKVDPARLERVWAEGAVEASTRWLADYWGKKTLAGLLLMPPTRHNFVHLNEAARIKKILDRKAT
jgi:hypothetical protein